MRDDKRGIVALLTSSPVALVATGDLATATAGFSAATPAVQSRGRSRPRSTSTDTRGDEFNKGCGTKASTPARRMVCSGRVPATRFGAGRGVPPTGISMATTLKCCLRPSPRVGPPSPRAAPRPRPAAHPLVAAPALLRLRRTSLPPRSASLASGHQVRSRTRPRRERSGPRTCPAILLDRQLVRVERLFVEDNHAAAQAVMEEILTLHEEHAVTLPADFLFRQAQVAFGAGLTDTAIAALNEDLLAAGGGCLLPRGARAAGCRGGGSPAGRGGAGSGGGRGKRRTLFGNRARCSGTAMCARRWSCGREAGWLWGVTR